MLNILCQVYGKQKRDMDPKAADIDFLLAKHPNLRVAYIDNVKGDDRSPLYLIRSIQLLSC
jgi:hypothetical protein